jgi:Cys-tRNA(Pro)/Cys-tRNA(Cys) deacylase
MPSPALREADEAGLDYRVISHGPVRNLAEAAQARGVSPADVVKTLVVRRADDDFLSSWCQATGPSRGRNCARYLR